MKTLFSTINTIYLKGFRQSSDATCGPASVILSSCGFGLAQEKESLWRDDFFAAWMPVQDFPVRGMALHELAFISQIIYKDNLEITFRRSFPENLPFFLDDIKDSIHEAKTVLIVNYLQDDFVRHNSPCELGNPHYSPLIDWNGERETVLIADVDPVINVPYEVSVHKLFQSMTKLNPSIPLPRGWIKLKLRGS